MTEPPPIHNQSNKNITGKFRRSKLINQVLFGSKRQVSHARSATVNILHIYIVGKFTANLASDKDIKR
jgi:hypothetical protein